MRQILSKEGEMKRIRMLVAVLGAAALAACGDNTIMSPTTPMEHPVPKQPADERVSDIVCAPCHGAHLLGVTDAGLPRR